MSSINVTTTSNPPAPPTTNGGNSLVGAPPPVFDGNRKKSQNFLYAFKGWRAVNHKKETMKNPFERTALILTYIRGDKVDDWMRHQLNQLFDKVHNKKYKDTDEKLWEEFEATFTEAFKDIGQTQDAHAELRTLKMKDGNIDEYTATFNRLIEEAGFPKTEKGTIEMYKDGLNKNLHASMLDDKPLPSTLEEWQTKALEKQISYLLKREILGKKDKLNQKGRLYQAFNIAKDKRRSNGSNRNNQVIPMEVDAVSTTSSSSGYSREQKDALKTLGLCYICAQKGHLAKACPNKQGQARRSLPDNLARPLPKDGHIRTTEAQDQQNSDLKPKDLLEEGKLRSLIMELNESDRADIIDVLLDF